MRWEQGRTEVDQLVANEYPQVDTPELTTEDVRDDVPKILDIVEISGTVLDSMPVY